MDNNNKHLPFRLLPDGSMEFLTLEAMLAARQHLAAPVPSAPPPAKSSSQQRRVKVRSPAKTAQRRKKPTAEATSPNADPPARRPPLPRETEILDLGHRRVLDVIFAAGPDGELSTRELGDRFPIHVIGENPSQTMVEIRSRLAKAGYLKGLVLDWRQGGFGPNKTMFYKAGPALMAGSPPPPQEDADALH